MRVWIVVFLLIWGAVEAAPSEEEVRAVLAALPASQRAALAQNRPYLRDFVLDLYSDWALAEEAERQGLAQDPKLAARVELFKRQALAEALLQRLGEQVRPPDAKALEKLARERYAQLKDKLKEPEQRRLAHILLRDAQDCPCDTSPPAVERAQTLREELLSGRDFAAAARDLSQDKVSAARGGELGWVRRDGKLVKPFEDAAFALKQPGEISPPVTTQFGVHLIKLLEVKPARQLPYEEVKQRLKEQIVAELRHSAMEQKRSQAYPDPEQLDLDRLAKIVEEVHKEQTDGK